MNCPLRTYPGLPAPSIPAEVLSFEIVQIKDFEVVEKSPFEGLVLVVPVIVEFKGIVTVKSSIFFPPGVSRTSNSPVSSSFVSMRIGMSMLFISGES